MNNIISKIKKYNIFLFIISLIFILGNTVYSQMINFDSIHRGQKVSWANNPDMSTNERFEDLGNILKDKLTGIKWEKNPTGNKNWENAKNHCISKGNGWRLPTMYELRTIISLKTKNGNNAYSKHPNITNGVYWTLSEYKPDNSKYWDIGFASGGFGYSNKNNTYNNIICVNSL